MKRTRTRKKNYEKQQEDNYIIAAISPVVRGFTGIFPLILTTPEIKQIFQPCFE